MEVNDFYRLSWQITEQLAPRIAPPYRKTILAAGGAGAWDLALPELIASLAIEKVVITTAQKDILRQLMDFRGEYLTYLEQIQTTD